MNGEIKLLFVKPVFSFSGQAALAWISSPGP